jgi:hypothetical protein
VGGLSQIFAAGDGKVMAEAAARWMSHCLSPFRVLCIQPTLITNAVKAGTITLEEDENWDKDAFATDQGSQ